MKSYKNMIHIHPVLQSAEKITLKRKSKISKSMKILFFLLQIVFGIDFGFIKILNKRYQNFAKCISIIISLIILVLLFVPTLCPGRYDVMWLTMSILQYLFFVLILNSTKYNFYDFVKDVNDISGEQLEIQKELYGILALVYMLTMYVIKYMINIVHLQRTNRLTCDNIMETIPHIDIFYNSAELSTDSVSIIFTLIYYYIYCCVKQLKLMVDRPEINLNQVKKYYLELANCYDKIIPLYDGLLTVELLFEVPRLMILVWYMLFFIKYEQEWFVYFSEAVSAGHIVFRLFLPCVITEMVNSRSEATKLILNYKLLEEKDEKQYDELSRLLQYMDTRRLEHKLWRITSVDMQLPLALISIWITYLLVVIQLTHLYD